MSQRWVNTAIIFHIFITSAYRCCFYLSLLPLCISNASVYLYCFCPFLLLMSISTASVHFFWSCLSLLLLSISFGHVYLYCFCLSLLHLSISAASVYLYWIHLSLLHLSISTASVYLYCFCPFLLLMSIPTTCPSQPKRTCPWFNLHWNTVHDTVHTSPWAFLIDWFMKYWRREITLLPNFKPLPTIKIRIKCIGSNKNVQPEKYSVSSLSSASNLSNIY